MVPGKGRGVVAIVDCPAGTEVERSPVILVPRADIITRPGLHSVFESYLLHWSDQPGAELAMGGGLLMLYNHSSTPNVEFQTGPEPLTMAVIALCDVRAGEELLYDYGVDLWFEEV
ncbi:MAG: SET domain-containing protein-lysine N-methyltransferase [bacterium]